MAQAIVDPEQLRNFAMQLKRFSGMLGEASTKVSQQMQQLAVSWRDQEHQKFSAEFEQEIKQLKRLVDASERHVPYLLRKAELIEEYQRGHG
ncbi:MAG: WXG100 family type VII secretion target [Pirellula sp.]